MYSLSLKQHVTAYAIAAIMLAGCRPPKQQVLSDTDPIVLQNTTLRENAERHTQQLLTLRQSAALKMLLEACMYERDALKNPEFSAYTSAREYTDRKLKTKVPELLALSTITENGKTPIITESHATLQRFNSDLRLAYDNFLKHPQDRTPQLMQIEHLLSSMQPLPTPRPLIESKNAESELGL